MSDMPGTDQDALLAAVADAVHAPSIFNTQPWRWVLEDSGLTLLADPTRRLAVVDPAGTLQLLSCGAALHHARISLAALGWSVEVDRLPARPYGDPEGMGEVAAHIHLLRRGEPDSAAAATRAAIPRRRTDRRPFGDEPVPLEVVAALTRAAVAEGVGLHRVRLDQMPMLAVAVAAAATSELASPRYRIELIQWTNRPEWSHDGVPVETTTQRVPRRVPVRDFVPASLAGPGAALAAEQGMPVAPGGDRGAAYLVLHGPGEERIDWLRAGEALSAVLLAAVGAGLAVAPFTDVLEVEHPRDLVRGLLPEPAHPYVVVRVGYAVGGEEPPASPRRDVAEVVVDGRDLQVPGRGVAG